jgi:hypothetical protein
MKTTLTSGLMPSGVFLSEEEAKRHEEYFEFMTDLSTRPNAYADQYWEIWQ